MGRPIITLTTDFGTSFSYVAEMKGVILDALDGDVEIVDVTYLLSRNRLPKQSWL